MRTFHVKMYKICLVLLGAIAPVALPVMPLPLAQASHDGAYDVDRPNLDGSHADLGSFQSGHSFGSPTQRAFIQWFKHDSPDSTITGWVVVNAKLFLDAPLEGGCAEVTLRFFSGYEGNGNTLATDSANVCGNAPMLSPARTSIQSVQHNTAIRSVRLCTRYLREGFGGPVVTEACDTKSRGDSG
jgi:hypothetical protein